MVAVLPIVVNALVIVPRLYGNVRTAEIAPESEHAGDIPNPSQEINSIGISRAIVRFAGEIASWQFRRRLEFSDKMVRNSTTNARATVEWPSSLASRWQGGPTVSALNSGCQEKIF